MLLCVTFLERVHFESSLFRTGSDKIFFCQNVSPGKWHVNNYTVLAQYNELLVPHNGISLATALKQSYFT